MGRKELIINYLGGRDSYLPCKLRVFSMIYFLTYSHTPKCTPTEAVFEPF
jgi:hypothetical protein